MATANAATQLADLLKSYATPNNVTPESQRGFSNANDLAAWRNHNAACELVRSVDNILIGMEAAGDDVDHFLSVLPTWYAGVHFATTPWGTRPNPQSKGTRAAATPQSISMLRALGSVLRAQGSLTIEEDARRTLVDTLEQARAIIESDLDTFTPDVRHYLLALLHRAEAVAGQAETYGAERVREVALELGGAVLTHAEAVEGNDPQKAGRLRAIGHMLVGGFMGRFGEQGADALTKGVSEATKMITG